MGRMHSGGKGISSSVIPYSRTLPSWLKTSAESVEESILRLSKVRRNVLSVIGVGLILTEFACTEGRDSLADWCHPP